MEEFMGRSSEETRAKASTDRTPSLPIPPAMVWGVTDREGVDAGRAASARASLQQGKPGNSKAKVGTYFSSKKKKKP